MKLWKRRGIIFYVLLSLIWIPVHMNTDVEVYEPYRYEIDDVEENQVVFACRLTGYSQDSCQDCIWVIQKDGTCRLKNLTADTKSAGENYKPEELTEDELLGRMDEYVKDETLPVMDTKLKLDKDTMNYCINLTEIEFNNYSSAITDGSQHARYYVVCGTGKDRHLQMIAAEGNETSECSDLKILHVYDAIGWICQMID